jgi:hypothetical protein
VCHQLKHIRSNEEQKKPDQWNNELTLQYVIGLSEGDDIGDLRQLYFVMRDVLQQLKEDGAPKPTPTMQRQAPSAQSSSSAATLATAKPR